MLILRRTIRQQRAVVEISEMKWLSRGCCFRISGKQIKRRGIDEFKERAKAAAEQAETSRPKRTRIKEGKEGEEEERRDVEALLPFCGDK